MTRYVEFPLEGGGTILIESADDPARAGGGFVRTAPGEPAREASEPARESFDTSVENVRRSADLLASKLRALSEPPDEMEVSFSLKASGEMGAMAVSKTGAESNYHVTLRWRRGDGAREEGDQKKEQGQEQHNGGTIPGAEALAGSIHRRLVEQAEPEFEAPDEGEDAL